MDTLKTLVVAGMVLTLLGGGAWWMFSPSSQEQPEQSGEFVGALPGPDISSPYLRFGRGYSVRRWATAIPFTAATTTVCAIQSPAATSTLVAGGVRFTVSSTTASTVTIAKAATAFATTTLINVASVGANAFATVLAASTTESSLAQTNRIFGPNEWLVVGMAGGVGTFTPTGICQATFEEFEVR